MFVRFIFGSDKLNIKFASPRYGCPYTAIWISQSYSKEYIALCYSTVMTQRLDSRTCLCIPITELAMLKLQTTRA
jgi:hypothetical protein